jgi:hypothetical protein
MRTDISIIYSCVQELPERERVILIEYYGLEGDALTLQANRLQAQYYA